jgi:hypothetical protein
MPSHTSTSVSKGIAEILTTLNGLTSKEEFGKDYLEVIRNNSTLEAINWVVDEGFTTVENEDSSINYLISSYKVFTTKTTDIRTLIKDLSTYQIKIGTEFYNLHIEHLTYLREKQGMYAVFTVFTAE